jgi:lipoyl(octanoyl) transferase
MTAATTSLALTQAGLMEYTEALELQRQIHHDVANSVRPNTLILLQHPPVYTAGRRTLDSEKPIDGSPVIDVDRGGKITFHGPGQIVGYPIIRLRNPNDVVGFVRELEAERFCERSGVWIRDEKGDRKIAAIGIRVARGVTMHGFALNVNPDLSYFDRIVPCGIVDAHVTSIHKELNREVAMSDVETVLQREMFEALMRVSS